MDLAVWLILLVFSIVLHELSHGWAAYVLGDDTAKRAGRLSLNPLKHLDPVWSVGLPLLLYFSTGGRFFFAMAKPVPVDFSRLQEPKIDMALVGFAGPLMNLLLAGIFASLWKLSGLVFFLYGVYLNLGLGIFNLFPVPPLDGSRVLAAFLPGRSAYVYLKIERFGYLILFALYFSGILFKLMLPALELACGFLEVPVLRFN